MISRWMRELGTRGLTLIEVIMTIVILGIGVLATLGTLLMFVHTSAGAAARTTAIQLAQAKLEACTAKGFQDATEHHGVHQDRLMLNNIVYHTMTQINSDDKYLANIDVTITWNDTRKNSHAVKFSTCIANLGD